MNRKPNRPKVTCAICKEQFSRITVKHLVKHGMTMEQYEELVGGKDPAPPAVPATLARTELLDNLTEWLTHDSPLSTLASKVVDTLMNEEGRRFSVMLRAVAGVKLQRMAKLFTTLDEVEKALLTTERIKDMTTGQLLMLKKMLDEDVMGTAELTHKIVSPKGPGIGVNFNTLVDQRSQVVKVDFPVSDDPQKREQLRHTIQALSRLVARSDDQKVG